MDDFKIKQSLKDYLSLDMSRNQLVDTLVPNYRVIEISKLSKKQLGSYMSMIIALLRNALHNGHHVEIVLKYERTRRVTTLKYPNFGLCGKKFRVMKPVLLISLLCLIQKMIIDNKISTVRDIYYQNVELFGCQKTIADLITTLEQVFQLEKSDFHIIAAQKGLIYTPVRFYYGNNSLINGNLIPYCDRNTNFHFDSVTSIKQVIIIEKEAIYNKLIRLPNLNKNSIIVTGKGYPDTLTKTLVRIILSLLSPQIPFKILTDSDPYGIDIFLKYANSEYEKCFQYSGVFIEHILRKKKANYGCSFVLPMTRREWNISKRLLHEVKYDKLNLSRTNKALIAKELQRQMFWFKKGEMNVLTDLIL